MKKQVNSIDFFDRAMLNNENNLNNVLLEVDPNLQLKINIPVGQIIPGDELQHHSTSIRNNLTCLASNILRLKENFLSVKYNITDHFHILC